MEEIDVYFESIKQVFNQIVNWPKRTQPIRQRIVGWLVGVAGLMFIFSLIPILPVLGLFAINQTSNSITLGNFVLIWIAATLSCAIVFFFLVWLKNKTDASASKPDEPPQTLSSDQLTFIAVYEAYKELRVYFVSHVDQHVENSLRSLGRAVTSRHWIREEMSKLRAADTALIAVGRNSDSDAEFLSSSHRRLTPSLREQVSVARLFLQTFERYPWFALDPGTKETLQALVSFPDKIPTRLQQRQDLPSILGILKSLSEFTYAFLPEHRTHLDTEALGKLHAIGLERLRDFVHEVNSLTHYPPSVTQKDNAFKAPRASWRTRLLSAYNHSVFLRFAAWFAINLVLTSGAVFAIGRYTTLSPDAMATLVVGTSVASAAALASFLPKDHKPD